MTVWCVTHKTGKVLIDAASRSGAKIMAGQLGARGVLTCAIATDEELSSMKIWEAEFNTSLGDPSVLDLKHLGAVS